MGTFKRIAVKDIKAMQKTLDELPDKNLGKTREEAADMLNANILKALEKGYTVKELAAIMGKGNVSIPPPVIRAKVVSPRAAKLKREPKPVAETAKAAPVTAAPVKPQQREPAWYTPDIPDTEL